MLRWFLFPFQKPTSVRQRFLVLLAIKTKFRNRLNVTHDMKVALEPKNWWKSNRCTHCHFDVFCLSLIVDRKSLKKLFSHLHHYFASTAQYFIMCSIQAPWRWITVTTRTVKFVMTLSHISWWIFLISGRILFLSASIVRGLLAWTVSFRYLHRK